MSIASPYYRTACVIVAILLLMFSHPSLLNSQSQETNPPVSMLTKEQKAELDTLNKQGTAAYGKGDLKTAESLWQQGLEKALALKDAVNTAPFLNNLGNVYWSLGQNEKALDYFTRSLALDEKIGNPASIARTLNNLGNVYSDLGQNEKALDFYNRALAIKEKIGNPVSIANTLLGLGGVYRSLGQNEKALDYYVRALAHYETIGNLVSIAGTLNNLGNVYRDLGQNEKAQEYYNRALALREKIGNPVHLAETLNSLGNIYSDLGQNEKALDYFTRALAIKEKVGNPTSISITLNNLGIVYAALGQNEKALDYFIRALAHYETIGNQSSIADTLTNLGNVYTILDENEKALDYFTRVLDIREKIGNPADIADTLNNLGNVYYSLRQNKKALDHYDRILTLREKIGNPARIAITLNNLGAVNSALGHNDKALDYYARALAIDEKIGNPADIGDTLNNLGNVYSDQGKLPEAEKQFAESKRLREVVSLQVGDPAQVGALQEKFYHFYERYARLRLRQNRPAEALEMLEEGRGQGLSRLLLVNLQGGLSRFLKPDEQQTLRQANEDLNAASKLRQNAQKLLTSCQPEQKPFFSKQAAERETLYQRAEQNYTTQYEQMFRTHKELNQLAGNKPVKMADLLQLATEHPDTLYLEYGIVDDKTSLLFVLGSKDGLKPLTLKFGDSALTETVQKWRAALGISGERGIKPDNVRSSAQARAREETLAKQAYSMLLEEVEKAGLLAAGRYKRLVFVGSGPILDMPLAALCDAKGRRLIERYPVSHAIALSVFLWESNHLLPKAYLLSITDPTGAREQTGSGEEKRGTREDNSTASHSVFHAEFPSLPGARAEGRAVVGQDAGSKLLIGPEAKEAEVTRLLPDYNILHFATHGYVVPRTPLSSGLVLAEEPSDSTFDGLLTGRKIANLPLSARLAVLSACETGRGKTQSGEGLMGLSWAFRAAGCPSLVVSQWAVNDAATKKWMLTFYKALKAGKSKDEAVQTAMLAVKTDGDPKHASPYFWAAFELVGETTPLNPMRSKQ